MATATDMIKELAEARDRESREKQEALRQELEAERACLAAIARPLLDVATEMQRDPKVTKRIYIRPLNGIDLANNNIEVGVYFAPRYSDTRRVFNYTLRVEDPRKIRVCAKHAYNYTSLEVAVFDSIAKALAFMIDTLADLIRKEK